MRQEQQGENEVKRVSDLVALALGIPTQGRGTGPELNLGVRSNPL